MAREGILIENPLTRLSEEQVHMLHQASIDILMDPGLISFNKEAVDIFDGNGAEVNSITPSDHPCWQVKIPERLVTSAIDSALVFG